MTMLAPVPWMMTCGALGLGSALTQPPGNRPGSQVPNGTFVWTKDAAKAHIHKQRQRRHPFTVWELLCVLAIIGIIAGLLMPSMTSARSRSVGSVCQSGLRQYSVAVSMYAKDFDSRPPTPENWLYSAASVSAEHPLACHWHDAGVSGGAVGVFR